MADSSGGEERQPPGEVLNEKFSAFVKFASTSITRAKQFTVEKLGRAESVTSYDDQFESLSVKIDQIKLNTERIIDTLESMIQPNPNIRLEEAVYSKLDRVQPHRSTGHELLGVELSRAGNEFGPETQYGGYLVRCGEVESKIGLAERRYQNTIKTDVLTPLKAFLEVDLKTLLREKRNLVVLRLDLDAAKAQAKKAQGDKAESNLRSIQADYDSKMEKVRGSMERIVQTHVNNMGHIKGYISTLKSYYTDCMTYLDDIGTEMSPPVVTSSDNEDILSHYDVDKSEAKKARVLYDYESEETDNHLSLLIDQVITVYPLKDDGDYYLAQVGDTIGKVPAAYLELI
ncbi:PREDICTED: endophilin-B1-like isoform X2 [Amphimedon queenslandica]|uniref:Uncharacterized protein n=1 Tax=Amphimedon queenslandica TaxID=400682 RepID=A0A1X7UHN1_AMPQE|nr:PREDICTED: endophilin-B1-like isoform X2 [Amphimedon queenslandica]|eukprot:XP_019854265.1 PREDICTED: endophilin-B1-like isoform X2 [Amphimedon queenslandica]